MYKTYVISYDPLMADPTPQRFIEFVRSHAYTYQFYTLFLGTIFIKSAAEQHEIIKTYRDFLSPNLWTIAEIADPMRAIGGSAPLQFWGWVNSPNPPPIEDQKN